MTLIHAKAPKSRALMLASFAGATAALALVIWIKLRVVTNLPKQAYADPKDAPPREVTGPVKATPKSPDSR